MPQLSLPFLNVKSPMVCLALKLGGSRRVAIWVNEHVHNPSILKTSPSTPPFLSLQVAPHLVMANEGSFSFASS